MLGTKIGGGKTSSHDGEVVAKLLSLVTRAHVAHMVTTDQREHDAFSELYENLPEHIDYLGEIVVRSGETIYDPFVCGKKMESLTDLGCIEECYEAVNAAYTQCYMYPCKAGAYQCIQRVMSKALYMLKHLKS